MPTHTYTYTARQRNGLRLLSFDAGGSRGISQLKILVEMMNRLNFEAISDDLDRPCAVFDMIGGVGTGGFIAILLVIFGLSAEEALDEFIDFSVTVLSKHDLDAKARTDVLKIQVNNLIDKYKLNQETRLLDPSDCSRGCKLAVPISYKRHVGSIYILRNHVICKEQTVNLTIADALLATVATPPLFETFLVFQEDVALEYMGADWILSNPTQEIIAEACGAFEPQDRVACLLSIGCGHAGVFALSDHNQSNNLIQIIENMAMDADRKAQSLDLQMEPLGLYYRFSVTSGLEKESKTFIDPSVIITHTEVYLNDKPISDKMDMCINTLTIREGVSTLYQLKHPGNKTASSILLPPLTNTFVMRRDAWNFVRTTLLGRNEPHSAHEPRILIVTGIGGCGKTQLMLKFMNEHEGEFAYRFFIDGSSEDRIHEDIVRNVRNFRKQYSQKEFSDCLAFLSQPPIDGTRGLLVYDNVDYLTLDLSSLLPRGSHCAIAITSRNSTLGDNYPETHLALDAMSMEEATELLLHLRVTITHPVRKDAEILAQMLGCLPIALQQAQSYMQQTKCSINTYLKRLSSSRYKLLGREIRHQLNLKAISTYATFETSFVRLSVHLQKLLRLLACFHWNRFPTELITLAAEHHFSDYEWMRLECADEFSMGKRMLEEIFLRNGEWDITDLDEAIVSLQSYSLVTSFWGVDTSLLRIHPLVHEWLRLSTAENDQREYQSAAILLLALGSRNNRNAATQYLASHVMHMSPLWDDLHVNDAVAFGHILHKNGLYQAASRLRDMVVRELRKNLAADDISLSNSIWELAVSYHGWGRWDDARSHQEEVLKLRETILGKNHPETIKVSSTLAVTYYELGRLQEAVSLQEEVLKLSIMSLGEQDPQTIRVSTQLGDSYRKLGRLQEAKKHQKRVLELTEAALGERHLETVEAKHRLALIYRDLWWLNEADALQSDILNLRHEIQGECHPQTIAARHHLANTYRKLGRLREAEELQEKVLKQRKEILGERHPKTISAIYNIANTYRTLGLLNKAEKLQEEILAMRREILGVRHPDTLKVYHCLALTYYNVGKLRKALEIQEEGLRLSKDVMGERHTYTICTMMNLGATYCQLGRLNEAVVLQESGLELSKDILGERHPIVLLVSNSLAITYHRLGQLEDAKILQEKVLKFQCEILGAQHPDTLVASSTLQAIYHDLGQTEEAEKTQCETLISLREVLSSRHFHTTSAMLVLANIKLSLQRKDETLELLTEANGIISEMLEVTHPQYIECQRLRSSLQSGENQPGLVGGHRGNKEPSTTPLVDVSQFQVCKVHIQEDFFQIPRIVSLNI